MTTQLFSNPRVSYLCSRSRFCIPLDSLLTCLYRALACHPHVTCHTSHHSVSRLWALPAPKDNTYEIELPHICTYLSFRKSYIMSDETRFNVPKLAADGSNWVVYCDQMIWAMGLCILSDHLTNITMPQTYLPSAINGVPLANQWAIGKATVKQAIAASVPDSIFNRIKGSTHAKDAWDALRALFEGRVQMIVVDLCWQLQTLKCREEDNVCTHFETIANLHKQLAAMGKSIPDEEYASILLGSLPTAYDATTSAMSTTASLTNTDLTPNTVIWLVTNEYNQRVLKNGRSKEPQDEALAADASQKGKGKPKKDIECFNCKKCGHMKADCWAKGGGKEGQGLKRKHQEGTATADQQAQQDIKAWAAIKQISDQDKDQSNFICKPWTESELYDSGALCHMSPFCHQFVSYRPITPCPIMAADKRLFFANGVGDLWIRVPNGKSFTPVILHDMLYAPNMALTVVSISHITKAGFAISFEGNTCKISNDKGNVVGKIPSNANGLYWVEHVCSASQADEVIDIHTLHCRLGHVAADSIHTLIRSQAIQGISLIDDGQPIYCESCKYTKATRKAIKKEREGVLASTFSERFTPMSEGHHHCRLSVGDVTTSLSLMTTPISPTPNSCASRMKLYKLTRTSPLGLRLSVG